MKKLIDFTNEEDLEIFFEMHKIPFKEIKLTERFDFDYCSRYYVGKIREVITHNNKRYFVIGSCLYEISSDDEVYNYIDKGRILFSQYSFELFEKGKIFFLMFNPTKKELEQISDFEKDIMKFINHSKGYGLFREDLIKIMKDKKIKEQIERTKRLQEVDKENELNERYKKYSKYIKRANTKKIIINKDKIQIYKKDDFFYLRVKNLFVNRYEPDPTFFYYSNLYQQLVEFIWRYDNYVKEFFKQPRKVILINGIKKEFYIQIKTTKLGKKLKYPYWLINGMRIPKHRFKNIMTFIYNYKDNNFTSELKTYIQNIKKYTLEQLELLAQGKQLTINVKSFKDLKVFLNLSFKCNDGVWYISFNELKKKYKVSYSVIKRLEDYYYDEFEFIRSMQEIFNMDKQFLINFIREKNKERELAEQRAKQLLYDTIKNNKRVKEIKDMEFLVQGRLRNYIVKFKDSDNVGVYTYPNMDYVCIEDRTREGKELNKYDILLSRILSLLNDHKLKEKIYTL